MAQVEQTSIGGITEHYDRAFRQTQVGDLYGATECRRKAEVELVAWMQRMNETMEILGGQVVQLFTEVREVKDELRRGRRPAGPVRGRRPEASREEESADGAERGASGSGSEAQEASGERLPQHDSDPGKAGKPTGRNG